MRGGCSSRDGVAQGYESVFLRRRAGVVSRQQNIDAASKWLIDSPSLPWTNVDRMTARSLR